MTNEDIRNIMETHTHDPGKVQGLILDLVEEDSNGVARVVDPTNAYMVVLEAAVAGASVSIDRSITSLQKRYPPLATTFDDLYRHMSDEDYLDRFATSTEATFTVIIQIETFHREALPETGKNYSRVTIPKDTMVVVDGINFSFTNRVEVRLHDSNKTIKVIEVPSDGEIIRRGVIPHRIVHSNDDTSNLIFEVTLSQIERTLMNYDINSETVFLKTLPLNGDFKSAEVFVLNSGNWEKIETTHTDQVFDDNILTAVLKVHEDSLSVYIPPLYTNAFGSLTEVAVKTTVTAGKVDLDLSTYSYLNYESTLRDLDIGVDNFNRAFSNTSYVIYSQDIVSGGRNALTFDEVKERMIHNTIGRPFVPVTPATTETTMLDAGYTSNVHLDTMTGRTYLLSSDVPGRDNMAMNSPIDVGFIDLRMSFNDLSKVDTVLKNGTSITVLPSTIYRLDGTQQEKVYIVDVSEMETWRGLANPDLIAAINDDIIRYSPWFYVYHSTPMVIWCNVYQMDSPVVHSVSYNDNNSSLGIYMSSDAVTLTYDTMQYHVDIHIKEDSSMVGIDPTLLYGQLSFIPPGSTERAYTEATTIVQVSDTDGGGYNVRFTLGTNMDIQYDAVVINNMLGTLGGDVILPLDGEMYVTYGVTSDEPEYVIDDITAITYTGDGTLVRKPIAVETINYTIGTELTELWRDVRPSGMDVEYMRAETDVKQVYTQVTAEVVNNKTYTIKDNCAGIELNTTHAIGEVVTDIDGNIIYQYRAGDILLDNDGYPILADEPSKVYKFSIMTLDARLLFVSDPEIMDYLEFVYRYVVQKSTKDLEHLLDIALEHTMIRYKPRDSLGWARIAYGDEDGTWTSKESRMGVVLHVDDTVFDSIEVRKHIIDITYRVISDIMTRTTVSHGDIITELTAEYESLVISTYVITDGDALTGLAKFKTATVEDKTDRFSLSKHLELSDSGLVTMTEDEIVEFIRYSID